MGNICSEPTGQTDMAPPSKAAEPMSEWPGDNDSEGLTKDIVESNIKEFQPGDLKTVEGKDDQTESYLNNNRLRVDELDNFDRLEDDVDVTLPHISAYDLMKRAKSMSNFKTKFNLVAQALNATALDVESAETTSHSSLVFDDQKSPDLT